MGKKIVATDCVFPAYPDQPFGWEDVSLKWTAKPNRGRVERMVTLSGKKEIQGQLELSLDCQRDNPDLDYSEDIAYHREIVRDVEAEGLLVRVGAEGRDEVYLNKDWLVKADAEMMLKAYAAAIGFPDVRIKWQRSKFVIIPVTFG